MRGELEFIDVVARIDPTGEVGQFVSEYMAYHVAWYRDYINAQNDPATECKFAGHTHVGAQVAVTNGEAAAEVQLDELLKVLL